MALSSSITGLDESIIKDFMFCGKPVPAQAEAFKKIHTKLESYSWYRMPATFHKIGKLSEEIQKCKHKEINI